MTTNDLIRHELFVKWLATQDVNLEKYWLNWLHENPADTDAFYSAKQFVEKIVASQQPRRFSDENQLWQRIQRSIQEKPPISKQPWISRIKSFWQVAAVIFILFSAILFYYLVNNGLPVEIHVQKAVIPTVKTQAGYIVRTNTSNKIRVVYLPDGSKVLLKPGSTLKNRLLLNAQNREVYFNGDAFFEVAKDANRPFYVYAKNTITRVLGTSFRVKTLSDDDGVLVAVKTGRVSVSRPAEKANTKAYETVLFPDQQIILGSGKHPVQTLITDEELGDQSNILMESFTYENEPVVNILDKLSEIYSINISYRRDLYKKCLLTTSLDNESLYDKLTILCKAIGAVYNVKDSSVVIEGGGCE